MNAIARLEYELAYYDFAFHRFNITPLGHKSSSSYTNANTYAETQADSNTQATPLFSYEHLLTSWILTSVLRPEERKTIFKNLSYHTMLTKLKRSAHLVKFWFSFHFRWLGPEKLNRMPQRSKLQLFNTMVGTQLLLSVYMAQVNFPVLDSMAENSILYV